MAQIKPRTARTQWTHPAVKGQALRDARLDKCMTLVEVCEACAEIDPLVKVTSSNLSRYERGAGSPSPKRLRLIAQVLDAESDDFLVRRRIRRTPATGVAA